MSQLDGDLSVTERWAIHWLDCPDCTVGDFPDQDTFCAAGAPLREAAVEDMYRRARSVGYGETYPEAAVAKPSDEDIAGAVAAVKRDPLAHKQQSPFEVHDEPQDGDVERVVDGERRWTTP